jgi:HlyD family secretion protein
MTATANIITRETPDALQVPTAALRYQPQGIPQSSGSQVWVSEGESVRPVAVQVGASNNGMTEIVGSDLSEGDEVIVGDAAETTGGAPGLALRELGSRFAGWMKPLSATLAGLAVR